jgi:hypothetical protein
MKQKMIFIKILKRILFALSLFLVLDSFGQGKESYHKYGIEIFPEVIPFGIYSAQFVYNISENDNFIIGFTYLNNYYPNKKEAIGRFFAPTIPIGYRRYLWKNLNIEGQLWPSYDFYKDLTQDKFFKGFDLVGSVRLGYKFDIKIKQFPFCINVQIEYLSGIYKGNKPENFDEVERGWPIFPAFSLGYKW